jgi:senataxin
MPSKVIMIGDPKQLPSTTFSPDAVQTNYNRSMFERMLIAGKEPFFLEIQYRMESNIREFASTAFYGGRLKDDDIIRKRDWPLYLRSFRRDDQRKLEDGEIGKKEGNDNLLFVEIKSSKERQVDFSFMNQGEANLALSLCQELISELKGFIRTNRQAQIGFISPYKAQIDYFRGLVRERLRDQMDEIQINTVDSFQVIFKYFFSLIVENNFSGTRKRCHNTFYSQIWKRYGVC